MERINVANFPEGVSAHLARTKLATLGIDGVVVRVSRYRGMAGAGFELRVPEKDLARAKKELDKINPGVDLDEYIDKDDPAYRHCPMCQSANVNRDPFNNTQRVVLLSTLGIGYVALTKSFRCKKCGHTWRER